MGLALELAKLGTETRKGELSSELSLLEPGAGKESRTPDLNLGKVALYQLSYSRKEPTIIPKSGRPVQSIA